MNQVLEKPTAISLAEGRLALLGGKPVVTEIPEDLFTWPIITREDEEAVLGVLRAGQMSGIALTQEFERDYERWSGAKHALGFNNGTASLLAAMFAVGVGEGDEVICPATTYWASALPAFSLGATVVFADIDAETLCLDPVKLERHITPRTKAIVVVHYLGHPAEMDAIMEIARRRGVKVIEDVSHAHGALYKGRMAGTLGDVAGYSLMAGKSLAVGEGGMLTTNDREIYERAVAFGHYERFGDEIESAALRPYAGLPLGGVKNRMHQLSSAVGRVQLRHYDERTREIRRAMNLFWDLLEGVPGLRSHRVDESTGSHMGGWYAPHGFYVAEELGGLSLSRFCEAVRAEGVPECIPGCNLPLHLHRIFQDADIYHHGRPTRLAHTDRDVREAVGTLPVAEAACGRTYAIPWFKHYIPEVIERYAAAYRKVAEKADKLRAEDPGDPASLGGWHFYQARKVPAPETAET